MDVDEEKLMHDLELCDRILVRLRAQGSNEAIVPVETAREVALQRLQRHYATPQPPGERTTNGS